MHRKTGVDMINSVDMAIRMTTISKNAHTSTSLDEVAATYLPSKLPKTSSSNTHKLLNTTILVTHNGRNVIT